MNVFYIFLIIKKQCTKQTIRRIKGIIEIKSYLAFDWLKYLSFSHSIFVLTTIGAVKSPVYSFYNRLYKEWNERKDEL